MHVIEQILGFSPDGGSGITELLFLVVLSIGLLLAATLRYRQTRNRR